MNKLKGGFTLPGESGYEALTLELAQRWGADVVRDSDGTKLSPEITKAGYNIYSTVCVIREHNDWLHSHLDCRQQTILMSQPCLATDSNLRIPLMKGYLRAQFEVNGAEKSMHYWQVFDRTENREVPRCDWHYFHETECVQLSDCAPFHVYTVNFFAWRIWEEISMYNHITNQWDQEHLMQLDPRSVEAQEHLLKWMERWCREHTDTDVVRFTSLFYNFVWIWGDDDRNRQLFTDWASYDFTVSPLALHEFEQKYGYPLFTEDFINAGRRNPCHMPPSVRLRDYIDFVNEFVTKLGSQLVDIVHKYGKKAYLFYDDSWVGTEPRGENFGKFGFDGIIKCVFSGYEARLCAAVQNVEVHELRLHPYLFPVGLGGVPTFAAGGDPARDALQYWVQVRRALARVGVDRIGLGGYLHLTEQFPDFVDTIENIAEEFRTLRALHQSGKPVCLPGKLGIVTAWGALRQWTCGGHYHEHPDLDLLNLLESLSGLPYEVEFFSLEELEHGVPKDIAVLINAGFAGSAWSGGAAWKSARLVESITRWVYEGGVFLGVGEPSAVSEEQGIRFALAHMFGVDADNGCMLCHGKWEVEPEKSVAQLFSELCYPQGTQVRLLNGEVQVLAQDEQRIQAALHPCGKGKGVYLCGYRHTIASAQTLLRCLQWLMDAPVQPGIVSIEAGTECAVYPQTKKALLFNNEGVERVASISVDGWRLTCALTPYGMQEISLEMGAQRYAPPHTLTLRELRAQIVTSAMRKALDFLSDPQTKQLPVGLYEIDGDAVFAKVQMYATLPQDELRFESHERYLDIQYLIEGEETILCTDATQMPVLERNAENDMTYHSERSEDLGSTPTTIKLCAGQLTVLPACVAHKPGCISGGTQAVKKILIKVKI